MFNSHAFFETSRRYLELVSISPATAERREAPVLLPQFSTSWVGHVSELGRYSNLSSAPARGDAA